MPTKTEWFKLRLSTRELDVWREAAHLARKPVSEYVRQSVASAIKLDTALREQDERERRQREIERRAAERVREARERGERRERQRQRDERALRRHYPIEYELLRGKRR